MTRQKAGLAGALDSAFQHDWEDWHATHNGLHTLESLGTDDRGRGVRGTDGGTAVEDSGSSFTGAACRPCGVHAAALRVGDERT